jgi:DNA-binding NarL/FixJ family response regulator
MKILLVDDHPLILSALSAMITALQPGVVVVTAEGASPARALLRAHTDFTLVLLDLNLGEQDGFEVLTEFRSTYGDLPVVVISASDRQSDVIRAVDAGAMGFIPKRADTQALNEALHVVMSGGIFLPSMGLGGPRVPAAAPSHGPAADLAHALRPDPAHPPASPATLASLGLTPRQSDVLALLLQGKPNKLIARELNVSVETVKDHVAAVLRALDVSTRTQAVLAVAQMTQQGGVNAWRAPSR